MAIYGSSLRYFVYMYIHNHPSTPLPAFIWKFSSSEAEKHSGRGRSLFLLDQLVQHAGKVRLSAHLINSVEEKKYDLGNKCVYLLVYKSVTKHGIFERNSCNSVPCLPHYLTA